MRVGLMALTCAFVVSPVLAQTPDTRWEPWIGCWELAIENVRDAVSELTPTDGAAAPAAVREGAPRVCVSHAGGGAAFDTTVAGQSASVQHVNADGVLRPFEEAGCSGTQRAEWSRNGLRLFSSAELRCPGDQEPRRVSGLSLLAPGGDWIDAQTVAIGSRETLRVKRYRRAADSPPSNLPTVATSALTLNEVTEALSKVSAGALEAALVETNAGFDLTSRNLIDLDAAGVPDRVIDLIVALSYPEKFVVQRINQDPWPETTAFARDPFLLGWTYGYPYFYDGFYYSPYFFEPFGYRGFLASGFGSVIVVDSGGSIPPVRSSGGRVVDGQGYTRIRPRDNTVAGFIGPSSRTSSRGAATANPEAGSSSSSSSGSSGGGSASSGGGYSSGESGGGGTGRTAVPRE